MATLERLIEKMSENYETLPDQEGLPQDYYATVADKMAGEAASEEPSGWKLADQIVRKQIESVGAGFNNMMQFGLSDETAALKDTVWNYFFGDESAPQGFKANLEATAAAEEEVRGEAPIPWVAGQAAAIVPQLIAGGGIGTGLLQSGAQKGLPFAKTALNTLKDKPIRSGAGLGAAEGAGYSLAEGQDPYWGAAEGGLAALGLGFIGRGIQQAWGGKSGALPPKGRRTAVSEIVKTMKERGFDIDEATEKAFLDKIEKLGPKASAMDANDLFLELAVATQTAGKNFGKDLRVTKMLRERMETSGKDFDEEITDLFGGTPQSKGELKVKQDKKFESLQPQYSKLMRENRNNTVPGNSIQKVIDAEFGGAKTPMKGGKREAMSNALKRLVRGHTKKIGMPDGSVTKYHTPEQLSALRDEIDGILDTGKFTGKKGQELTLNRKMKRQLTRIRNGINEQFHKAVPGIDKIDGKYATEYQRSAAYDMGESFAGKSSNKTGTTAADAKLWRDRANSEQLMSAAEGFKHSIYQKIDAAKTPEAKMKVLKDKELRNKANLLLGSSDLVDGIFTAAEKYVMFTRSGKVSASAAKTASEARRTGVDPRRKAKDVAVAAAAPLGVTSTVGATSSITDLLRTPGMKMNRGGLDELDQILSKQGPDAAAELQQVFKDKARMDLPFAGTPGIPSLGAQVNIDQSE